MPKGRPPTKNPWVKHKIEILQLRNCYIYKRPRSAVWQYYLQMDSVETRKTTGVQGDNDDIINDSAPLDPEAFLPFADTISGSRWPGVNGAPGK